ncbi:MAG: thiamine pyrophosphate-binding protein [Deltaproteobacteria bacterium]|nr:thiamine pyrophosphate-binding protein [Deltaproteobacteria bacterium]MBW1950996.1 thiamine pyrophosphate-binding protein [Deltaproteobacteria bacterium]MBW2349222.1 thiamine pyrophosphate-binding protein [Deltaproteobacteria bacterium]RLB37440.1 MAG: thiamine pyrophosphate-binding protein [Deltaproteobacteria bacterium]
MTEIFGGHLVAEYLKEVEGVDTVFSLAGGHIDRIYDGFLEAGIRLIDVRHEQAAAMMAHAWSVITRRPGVCLVTAGPGFTNSLTGLVNAYQENVPVVLMSGTSPVRDRGLGALQDMKQADMIKSTVKWHDICLDVKRIPEYISTAFRHAVSGRPGPVFLELPPDVLNVGVEKDAIQMPGKGGLVYKSRPEPSLLEAAADLINKAQKPFIIGGSGVGTSVCEEEIRRFIDTTGIPFALINSGRGTVPDEHPLSLWDGGLMAVLTALGQADLVVALGIRFNWILMFGQIFPQAKMVRVDIEATEIDRNRTSDVGLVGDLGLTLGELNDLVEKRDHSAWREALKQAYLPMVQEEVDARHKPSHPIHPARLVEQVRRAAGDDAIYVVDGGDTSYFGIVGLRAKERASVMHAAGGQFGCLGTGIPFAIAAKAARPQRTVVVINGDGSFGLNAMEFCTAVRHDLPFVCVVNNDGAWGMIKHGQELSYGNERVIGSELGVVHYEQLAQALGGYGELVEKDEDIMPAVKRALDSGKPACINVLTDPAVISPATLQFVEGFKME